MTISRTKLKNEIYKMTSYLTSVKYRDDSWEGVNLIFGAIRYAISSNCLNYELKVVVENGGYHTSSDGQSGWKEWKLYIVNPETNEEIINGTLYAHAAGTIEYPFNAYDMSLLIFLA